LAKFANVFVNATVVMYPMYQLQLERVVILYSEKS